MAVFSSDYLIEIARKLEAEGKLDDGRVLVRWGRLIFVLHGGHPQWACSARSQG
jgi:hypothetical protein